MQFLLVLVISFQLTLGFSTKIKDNSKIPSFNLAKDRSEDGSPTVDVFFPDGYRDRILLQRHEDADETDCHYIGHLEKEKSTCIAMTGCPGKDDLEFTLFSTHLTHPGTFKWLKDGTVHFLEYPVSRLHFKLYV